MGYDHDYSTQRFYVMIALAFSDTKEDGLARLATSPSSFNQNFSAYSLASDRGLLVSLWGRALPAAIAWAHSSTCLYTSRGRNEVRRSLLAS